MPTTEKLVYPEGSFPPKSASWWASGPSLVKVKKYKIQNSNFKIQIQNGGRGALSPTLIKNRKSSGELCFFFNSFFWRPLSAQVFFRGMVMAQWTCGVFRYYLLNCSFNEQFLYICFKIIFAVSIPILHDFRLVLNGRENKSSQYTTRSSPKWNILTSWSLVRFKQICKKKHIL